MDLCSSVEDDFIVVTPSEAGEPPLEYCAQDESRYVWEPGISLLENIVVLQN